MTNSQEPHPHVGSAEGQSSRESADGPAPQEHGEPASGEIEIPVGMPISDEEFRRLKREAERAHRDPDPPADAQPEADQDDPEEPEGTDPE